MYGNKDIYNSNTKSFECTDSVQYIIRIEYKMYGLKRNTTAALCSTGIFLALRDSCKLSNLCYHYVCYNLNDLFFSQYHCVLNW